MVKVTVNEGLKMLKFLQDNINNPQALANEYFANQAKYDQLAKQYPQYRDYLKQAPPGMIKKLRDLGVPL